MNYSPRTEQLLAMRTQELQAKVDTLERRVREQSIELSQKSRLAFKGGTFGDHWAQCVGHFGQAFASLCRSGTRSGTVEPIDHEGSSNASIPRPRSPMRVSSVQGRRDGKSSKSLIPDWSSGVERRFKAVELLPQLNENKIYSNEGPFEDHEYLLDDEWGVLPSNCIIYPKSKWKETWDLTVLFMILYSAVTVPFRICFSAEAEGWLLVFEIFVSLIFCVDVIFNFNQAYLIDDKWIISRSRIASRYLRSWFWIDAPSSVPIELITLLAATEANSQLTLLRFLRMFRLLRLLRLLKIDVYIARIEDTFEINLVSLRILGMVTRLLFMVHFLGCFWWYVAICSLEAGYETSWTLAYNGGAAMEAPVNLQYRYSVYWALTTLTTVGYGDLTPQNDWERDYCMLAMLIGAMMFGYMVSTIGSMVATLDKEAAIKEDRMDAVKEWMASRNIQQKLFVRVRNYYQHYYTKKSAFNEDEILASLTPSLRNECTAVLLRETLGIFPLLAVLGIDFQRAVYPHLKPVMHAHQDVIYARGEKAEDIYFLRNGTVDVLAGGLGTEVLFRINHGQHFGEEVLTNQKRASHVTSNGMSEMWTLTKDALEGAVRLLPGARTKLEQFCALELERKQRLNSLSYRALIASAGSAERRAALIMQKAWVSYANKKAREASILAPIPAYPEDAGAGKPTTTQSGALQAALAEIKQELKTMKATISSQGGMLEHVARFTREQEKERNKYGA